ncbi:MAG: hypothetical protein V5B31_12980 [Candidatus Accumulibacter propinquus]|jgi:Tfp pilus assembly protein PilF|uniref:hypothetical protein n=1 Tax=Candidatus Accumulibacter propinquus TaxID=2954380 RepID=UPI002FC32BD1
MPEVLDRCQACRARLAGSAVCPRCGCDFSLVRQAQAQAKCLLDRAVGSLAGGDLARARVLIDAALAIDRQQLGLALKAFLDSQAAATESRPQAHRAGPLAELLATTEPEAARRSL